MLITLALIGLITIILIYDLWQQRKITKLQQQIIDLKRQSENLVTPGLNIIQSATQKADEILSQAEMEAIKIPLKTELESGLFEQQLNQRLDRYLEKFNSSVEGSLKHFQDNLNLSLASDKLKQDQFLEELTKRSLDFELLIQSNVKAKVEQLLIDFEQKMTDFFTNAEQKSTEAINLEIASARQLIDSYKSQQLSIVDENIIAVLERTLNIVLNEKLSLKDQLDLVYEALERAKIEKFLV